MQSVRDTYGAALGSMALKKESCTDNSLPTRQAIKTALDIVFRIMFITIFKLITK